MSRPFCAGPNGQPITIPTGGDLYQQASLISGCFKNPVVECPSNVDNTQNFCFSITDSAPGATAQTVVVPLQLVNAVVNPSVAAEQVRDAKARIAARATTAGGKSSSSVSCDQDACQYLSLQTNPCNSSAYGTCTQDPLCSAYDHPGCNGCCTNPYGVILQESGTLPASSINAYCSASLNPSSTNALCLPCSPGSIPILRPGGNDNTMTYYTCTNQYVAITLTCNVSGNGTMHYQVTHSDNSTEPEVALTFGGTQTGIAYLVPGDTITVSNLTTSGPGFCVDNGSYQITETAQFDSFYFTYANATGNTASIVFSGQACPVILSCTDKNQAIMCAGSLEVMLTGFTGTPTIVQQGSLQSASTCKQHHCNYASGSP